MGAKKLKKADQELCPTCQKDNPPDRLFCGWCGNRMPGELNVSTKHAKPAAPKVGKTGVDAAFENLGLDDKFLSEHGTTKEAIMGEIAAGFKPKEDVAIQHEMQGGSFDRNI